MALRLGLVISTNEIPAEDRSVPWVDLREMARMAEQVGFDSVWVPDELMWPSDHGPMGFWEGTSVLSAVAASTSRVDIGTSVLCVTYRNPVLVAKIASTIDEISGGRMVLGLGPGYPKEIHAAYGYPNDHQYSRFAEAFAIIAALLRDGTADKQGRYHEANQAEIRPRASGIPILVAAGGPKMMRLAAQQADRWNWFSFGDPGPQYFTPYLRRLDEACSAVGRDPATLIRTVDLLVAPTGEVEALPFGEPITGSTDEIADLLSSLGEAGISEIRMAAWPPTARSVEALAPVVGLLTAN